MNYIDTSYETYQMTSQEQTAGYILGVNNAIILSSDSFHGLMAYDAWCPNCIAENNWQLYDDCRVIRYNSQQVRCPHCGRIYNVGVNGYILEGNPGLNLVKYNVTYNYETGILVISMT